ncbi:hypothetical protein ACLOJK_019780 [Asimina triloba]
MAAKEEDKKWRIRMMTGQQREWEGTMMLRTTMALRTMMALRITMMLRMTKLEGEGRKVKAKNDNIEVENDDRGRGRGGRRHDEAAEGTVNGKTLGNDE